MSKAGFIYLWYDSKRKLFYLGSHLGDQSDGYVGSNHRLQLAYDSRPETFKRRILEEYESITSKELLEREQLWLDLIKPDELHCVRYYNEKRVAAGGDIVSDLPEERRKLHRERSIAARVRGQRRDRKLNPEKWRKISALGGAATGIENVRQAEVYAKRSNTDSFMTPLGPRPFLTKAAKELGVSYVYLRKLVDKGEGGYYWIDKGSFFYK